VFLTILPWKLGVAGVHQWRGSILKDVEAPAAAQGSRLLMQMQQLADFDLVQGRTATAWKTAPTESATESPCCRWLALLFFRWLSVLPLWSSLALPLLRAHHHPFVDFGQERWCEQPLEEVEGEVEAEVGEEEEAGKTEVGGWDKRGRP